MKDERTILRKYFHFLAIIVYTSGILFDTSLLTMCSVAFIVLLLLLEVIQLINKEKEQSIGILVYENQECRSIW